MDASSPLPAPPPDDRVPARYARGLLEAAAAFGADRDALCARAGLSREDVAVPDGWICGTKMTSLWRAAVEQTENPDLGLRIGNSFRVSALSLVGYLMASAPTLGDAFGDLARYYPLLSTGPAARLIDPGGGANAALEFDPVTSGYPILAPRQPFEVVLGAVPAVAETLTGRRLPVASVAFAHARPATGTAAHEEVFGVVPAFDAPCYRVRFRADALGWPVRAANPGLHASLARDAERAIARRAATTRTQVAAVIEARLDGRVPTLAEVARVLAIGERTLQRRLGDEGLTFQAVCDDVRHRVALRLIADEAHSVQAVADRLGYSAPSAFNRAFKRWTGQAPTAFRAAATEREGRT